MDLIERQAAIDAIDKLHDKPNAWLECAVEAIEKLPSAQPELIRCKDCKYYKALDYTGYLGCNRRARAAFKMDLNDFCSRAERREDE